MISQPTGFDHAPRHVPERTCIGCRRRGPQTDLLRVVCVEGRVMPDQRRRRTGRGAYLHVTADCWERALRRKAFARALRVAGPLDLSTVQQSVLAMTETEVGSVGMSTR